jgi:O-antigen/teichoic acid export membrane protein
MPNGALLPLGAVAAIAQAQMETLCGDLWGHDRFRAAAILRLAAGGLAVGGAAVLSFLGPTALGAMLVFATSRALPVTMLRAIYPASPRAFRRAVSWRSSLPFGLTAFINGAYVQSDLLILAAFGTAAADLGTYGLGYNVLVGLQVIPASISATLFPRIARSDATGASDSLRRGLLLSYAVAAGVSALMLLDLKGAFQLFGSTYADGVEQIRPLLLVLLPLAISQVGTAALQARNQAAATLRIAVATLIVNVCLNLILIGPFGVRGAVLATTAAELFSVAAILTVLNHSGFGDFRAAACLLLLPIVGAGLSQLPSWIVGVSILTTLLALWGVNGLGIRTQTQGLVDALKRRLSLSIADS